MNLLNLLVVPVFFLQFYSAFVFIVNSLKIKFNALQTLVLSLVFGIAFNASLFFLGGYIFGVRVYFVSYFILLWGLYQFKTSWKIAKESLVILKKDLTAVFIMLVGSVYWWLTIGLSGLGINGNLIFEDGQFHDSMWHIALIKELGKSVPPVHPSSFLYTLKHYHYFWDINIAALIKAYLFTPFFLYYRFFPLVLVVLVSFSAYILIKKISASKFSTSVFLFLLFFGGNFAYFIPFFIKGQNWSESSFWVSQTFRMMVNPQLVFSFAVLFAVLFLLYFFPKKINFPLTVFTAFLLGSCVGFKSYGFVASSIIVAMFFLYRLLIQRQLKTIFIEGIVFSVVALPFYLLVVGLDSAGFIWEPLWYLRTMVEAPDRLNLIEWQFLDQYYSATGNWPRLILLKLKEFVIFFAGNLGIRILALLSLLAWKIKDKKYIFFIWSGFIFAVAFPLFFLQVGLVWNSIQFWYYALVLADILVAVGLSLFEKQLKNRFVKISFLLILIILTIPAVINFSFDRFGHFRTIKQNDLVLFDSIPAESRVFMCPHSGIYNTSELAALSKGRVLMANPVQLEILGENYKTKEENLKRIFDQKDFNALKQLISDYKIDYIICDQEYLKKFIDSINSEIMVNGSDNSLYLKII